MSLAVMVSGYLSIYTYRSSIFYTALSISRLCLNFLYCRTWKVLLKYATGEVFNDCPESSQGWNLELSVLAKKFDLKLKSVNASASASGN